MAVKDANLFHREVPKWLRRPADFTVPAGATELCDRINEFFEECVANDTRPTVTGLALSVGLPGPTSLLRLGQRLPELRYVISRSLAAVAYGYEEMLASGIGSSGAQFMLKNLPDFDPDEPSGSSPVQFFNDRKEILLSAEVHGAAYDEDAMEEANAIEAYVQMLKKKGMSTTWKERDTSELVHQDEPRQNYALRILGPTKRTGTDG